MKTVELSQKKIPELLKTWTMTITSKEWPELVPPHGLKCWWSDVDFDVWKILAFFVLNVRKHSSRCYSNSLILDSVDLKVAYHKKIWHRCHGVLLGQSFVSSGRGRGPFQDEDHSGSRPRSFPGLNLMRAGMAPEWFRSVPVVAGS